MANIINSVPVPESPEDGCDHVMNGERPAVYASQEVDSFGPLDPPYAV